MPLIDVVIPNYCYGRYLPACIASVVSQGVEDIRILIVDNASTDDSVEVARALASRDSRITVVARERNLGHHASYNFGVDWAESKYFLLLCADDLLAEGCFTRAMAIMEQEPDVSLACGTELVWREEEAFPSISAPQDENWRIVSCEEFTLARSLPSKLLFGSGAALIRTADLKRVGHFRAENAFNEDLDLFLRLSLNRKVALNDAVHGIRRVHGTNMSAVFWSDFKKDVVETRRTFEVFFSRDAAGMPGVRKLRRATLRNLGKRAYWSAISHLVRGRVSDSMQLAKLALELSPSMALLPPVDYLWQLNNPVERIRSRLLEAVSARRTT